MENSTALDEMRSEVRQVTKEGFNFKAFKSVVDGKYSVKPGITYKRGGLRAYVNSDLKNDHKVYIEKQWTF